MSDQEAVASKFRRLVELREKRDEDKATAEASEGEYREYEAELWDEVADGPIKGTLKLDLGEPYGIVRFTPRETYYGRVTDLDKALDYFETRAMTDEMTKPKIEKRKLNEMVRELLESQEGKLPDGIDFYANRGFTITRTKR